MPRAGGPAFSGGARRAGLLALGWMLAGPLGAQDLAEPLAKTAREAIETADTDAIFQKADLAKKYATALEALEKKLSAAGDLDAVLRVREEREEVLKSGNTTAHKDKALADLRAKYATALDVIEQGMVVARKKALEDLRTSLRSAESELVRQGKVDEAVALREQGVLAIEQLGGSASPPGESAGQGDSHSQGQAGLQDLPDITIPSEIPEEFEKPFLQPERWLDSLTVPQSRQRIRENVVIGDRAKKAWPLIRVTPGSHWVGTGETIIELSAGKWVSEGSRYEKIRFFADLACDFYFTRGIFEDCRFDKGGVWYGSDQAGKFYFRECLVRGSFAGATINVVDNGIRAEKSVFENITFPSMRFRNKQPADYLNHPWLRLVHCRFIDCTLPLSFLYLTRECVFENCVFVDDSTPSKPEEERVLKPLHLVLYTENGKNRITRLPENVTLEERRPANLNNVSIPTARDLLR